jgi:hypothetical protein
MPASPVEPAVLTALGGLVLVLVLVFVREKGWVGGKPAAAIGVLIVLAVAGLTWMRPALPIVDQSLGDGLPFDHR